MRTVPVGAIAELIRGDVFYWGQLMAAALLGSVPVAIIYSFFVEYYVAGLTAGSVKDDDEDRPRGYLDRRHRRAGRFATR